jgi:hypothetical protein
MSCPFCDASRELVDAQQQVAWVIIDLADALLHLVDNEHAKTLELMRTALMDIIKTGHELAEIRPGPPTTVQ